ncbi:hypothetical protein M431DRAFT_458678 [Trichoderma harzianum CBS 226.95]|uniref:Uncharacterized protein n=1 Tax=Trichoderma harzianum CBS 226.95 TaxID=983964 RepID=A0A2T4A7X3_TRIHA|nr:hypothetical protein M431DRAFT_458678 [Trichoderma harzianum CBS 226.95]PTB53174.1 hypothetical protein M431DRAFT_458678 [Trichoderma harzianum CBS 226.95]
MSISTGTYIHLLLFSLTVQNSFIVFSSISNFARFSLPRSIHLKSPRLPALLAGAPCLAPCHTDGIEIRFSADPSFGLVCRFLHTLGIAPHARTRGFCPAHQRGCTAIEFPIDPSKCCCYLDCDSVLTKDLSSSITN